MSQRILRYTDWVWSPDHNQFYNAAYDQYGNFVQYNWSGASTVGGAPAAPISQPPAQSSSKPRTLPSADYPLENVQPHSPPSTNYTPGPQQPGLSIDVQQSVGGYKPRRLIKTGNDGNDVEPLDYRYARVIASHVPFFFVCGRVFKILWTEPAGQQNPGQTRGSTHFSVVTYGENAYSEIRRFIVVNPKGSFSQCIPIQTYRNRGALKPGLLVEDHGLVYTGDASTKAPDLLYGEGITKQPIRVEPVNNEVLLKQSRINFGKPYAVEHNVKIMEIGMVAPEHIHLLKAYFEEATKVK